MKIQYLITVTQKNQKELKALLESTNIRGEILVGNQLMENDSEYEIITDNYTAKIFNLKSKGVSLNRNFLTLKSTADYITYLDDDMYIDTDVQSKIEQVISANTHNAIRFNVVSDNIERPIRFLNKKGFVGFRSLSSYGVCGIYFKRQFLLDYNLFFREDIGPGTQINHGEDGLFLKLFCEYSKVYSAPILAFHARQSESTWQVENRNLFLEMYSHGYVYQLLYGKSAKLMACLFALTHKYLYPRKTSTRLLIKYMFKGIKDSKNKKSPRQNQNRVLILGPVVSLRTSGGVAVFDEGLAEGFKELGDISNVLSIEKSKNLDNLLINMRNPRPWKLLFNFSKVARMIKKFQPDLVISSLHYSIGIKKYKRHWKHASYVQVLHGFPCPINGRLKSFLVNSVAKYSRKHFDYVVAVSYLTYAINKKINNITCDRVIHNGCSLKPNLSKRERSIDYIYVGRLFKDKEVEMIGDAFRLMKANNPDLRLVVAGYGELEPLFSKGKFSDCGIEYLGKLSQDEVRQYLEQSKFFISMNPLEPFGTVFNEAVMNGCNIVTQSSTGSMSLFIQKKYFHCADCVDHIELCETLINILPNYVPIDEDEKKTFIDYMAFSRAAKEYKELAKII